MVYAAAFAIGVLMCATLVVSGAILFRDTVDRDQLMHGTLSLLIGALAIGLVMAASPEAALTVGLSYFIGSCAMLLAFGFSGLVRVTRPEPAPVSLRPDSVLRDPASTVH